MRRFVIIICLLGAFVVCGCSGSRSAGTTMVPAGSTTPMADASLGPGDVFDIRVYGEKELSNTFRVASNGTIDFPLVGTVHVSGLTPSEVKGVIEKGLIDGGFLKAPQVSILVEEYSSKKVSVFGQVNKPGMFSYSEGMGVVEAISRAGGFTPMARVGNTTITRSKDGQKETFVIAVDKIASGNAPDFQLRPGDIVFVPERVF